MINLAWCCIIDEEDSVWERDPTRECYLRIEPHTSPLILALFNELAYLLVHCLFKILACIEREIRVADRDVVTQFARHSPGEEGRTERQRGGGYRHTAPNEEDVGH